MYNKGLFDLEDRIEQIKDRLRRWYDVKDKQNMAYEMRKRGSSYCVYENDNNQPEDCYEDRNEALAVVEELNKDYRKQTLKAVKQRVQKVKNRIKSR